MKPEVSPAAQLQCGGRDFNNIDCIQECVDPTAAGVDAAQINVQ